MTDGHGRGGGSAAGTSGWRPGCCSRPAGQGTTLGGPGPDVLAAEPAWLRGGPCSNQHRAAPTGSACGSPGDPVGRALPTPVQGVPGTTLGGARTLHHGSGHRHTPASAGVSAPVRCAFHNQPTHRASNLIQGKCFWDTCTCVC